MDLCAPFCPANLQLHSTRVQHVVCHNRARTKGSQASRLSEGVTSRCSPLLPLRTDKGERLTVGSRATEPPRSTTEDHLTAATRKTVETGASPFNTDAELHSANPASAVQRGSWLRLEQRSACTEQMATKQPYTLPTPGMPEPRQAAVSFTGPDFHPPSGPVSLPTKALSMLPDFCFAEGFSSLLSFAFEL